MPTLAGWVYMAVVLDLFSRKVVGWDVSDSLATPLVATALRRAIESRRPIGGELLHHSAVAERFFWSLKHEWTQHERFADLEAARMSVFKYIETFYNPVRLHRALGYKSPNEFETEYAPVLAA